jgi:hypothetical protein
MALGQFGDGVQIRITATPNPGGTVNPIEFEQLGLGQLFGTLPFGDTRVPFNNYWTEGSPKPYTGNALVSNAPTAYEMVALDQAGTFTVTFDKPVIRPLMAIVSLGTASAPVTWAFDKPFTVLSSGQGFWGSGTASVTPTSITGREFHGLIQFEGTITSITWSSSREENWQGFTFGQACYVPSGESIRFADCSKGIASCWGPTWPTTGMWVATLNRSPGQDFSGRYVREVTAGPGTDTCWFSSSDFPALNAIPAEYEKTPIEVDQNNEYRDVVGLIGSAAHPSAASYYRDRGRAPCQFTVPQRMEMLCPDGSWKPFVDHNTLSGGVTSNSVWSSRVGPNATVIERQFRRW